MAIIISQLAPFISGANITSTTVADAAFASGSTVTSAGAGDSGKLIKLDAAGNVDVTALPGVALTDINSVASEVAQLALVVQSGDVCIRTDESKTYVAINSDNVDMGDWQEMLSPTDAVQSVNSNTGTVVLDMDDFLDGSTNAAITLTQETNFETAYSHSQAAHAPSGADVTASNETSHTDVVVDGDFTSNGIMTRTAAGVYAMTDDNSTEWDTAYTHSQAAHAPSGADETSANETSHADVVVDADIGVNVQAYDSTILNDADIGVNVQAYDSTILVDADIGVNVQAYDSTILVDADIGVNVQGYSSVLANTTASFLTAQETKLSYITVVQAVDLDDMETKAGTGSTHAGTTHAAVATYTTKVTGDSPYTVVAGDYLFADVSSGALTATLPSSPAVGVIVEVVDVAGNCGTNNITVDSNTTKIRGSVQNITMDVAYSHIRLVYSGATYGWMFDSIA